MLFIQSISNISLLTYLNKLQQILTLTIESVEAESDFLEDLVRLIDVFWRVNQSKPIDDRISAKAFQNETLNTLVDLKPQMFLWAKQTRSQVLKNEVIESTE